MRSAALKRLFDLGVACCGLVVLGPLLALIAIAIRLSGRGSILFKQERIGVSFEPFMMYKFRTMVPGATEQEAVLSVGDDERVTRVGRVLRQTKLDELPQLLNVLQGQMSLVGPRPELRKYVRLFRPEYDEILKVRPGITDIASILYRDEARLLGKAKDSEALYLERILPDKIRLGREYVRRRSLPYDLWLLVSTVVCLLYPKRTVDRVFELVGRRHRAASWIVQGALVLVAHYLAVDIRFEGKIPAHDAEILRETLPILFALRIAAIAIFGLHRSMWRYVGIKDTQRIIAAMAVSSLAFWLALTQIIGVTSYSRAVLVTDALLAALLIAGVRLVRRMQSGVRKEFQLSRRVILISGGDAAERILFEIAKEPDYEVMGVLDEDPRRKGLTIHGVPILGGLADLTAVVSARGPDAVVIDGGSVTMAARREIMATCSRLDTPIMTVPGFRDVLTARMLPAEVGSGRVEPQVLDETLSSNRILLERFFTGRRVLITGAGGSVGSEICRQIAQLGPQWLGLLDHHESSLFEIDRELREAHPALDPQAILGDVTDGARVDQVVAEARPEVIFHAAAYKHLLLSESNPAAAFKTNLLGTRLMAEAALRHGVERFVLISTEQAVDPAGALGLSKRGAELTVQSLREEGSTRFVVVRSGNLVENDGGLLPRLREQIERGGPVTLAHPDVTRVFITVPEAVQLILQTATMAQGGEVFVLDMGKPVRVLDVAQALIRGHGLTPGKDIEVVFTGLAPGERPFEKLFDEHEMVWKTSHPRIFTATNGISTSAGLERIRNLMKTVEARLYRGDAAQVREALARTLD